MTPTQARAFLAVAIEGSFTGAAKQCADRGLGSALAAKAPPDKSSGERRDGFTHISPARSIFSSVLDFCRCLSKK
jgi:hypothetical protein